MGYRSFNPEAALEFRILLYCMAYILGGAALIGLSLYLALLSSEMFFSHPRSKAQCAKVPQSARRAPVAKGSLDLPVAETPIRAAQECPAKPGGRVAASQGAQIPMTVAANLESEPTLL
jgi:hypothetical protein